MEKHLEEVFPIWGIEHDCIISKNGDMTVGYEITLPEIFTLSNQEYESLHLAWVRAMKLLPGDSVLHKQDWFLEGRYLAQFGQDTAFLTESSNRFFNERPYLHHRCYVYLTKKTKGRKESSSMFSSLLRHTLVPEQLLNKNVLSDFLDSCGQFTRVLKDSGMLELRRLTSHDLLSTKHGCGIIEQYCSLPDSTDRRMARDIRLKENLQIGNNYCQLYTLSDPADMPQYCGPRINYDKYSSDKTKFSIGFSAPLGLLLSCNHLYNQYVFIGDSHKKIQELERKVLRLHSLSAYSRENNITRDAINEYLNEAISEQRTPIRAHFNVQVWSSDREQLKDIKNKVASAMSQMEAITREETVGAAQIWWAGIPGNCADFPMNDTFDCFMEQAACFFNSETNYQSSISPIGIRLADRLTGRPVHLDISDEPMKKGIITNRNKFILGPSGSGKSFFTNHMVRSYYEQGTHVVIVDVGHSYKGLSDMVNGYYFTYSEENPIKFNPFYIGEGDSMDTEKKESIKTLLVALWKTDSEQFKRSEYVALSNAIQLYYEKLNKEPSLFPCFDSFYEFLRDDFVKVLEGEGVKEKEFDVANFLYVLRPYYSGGEFSYLLNARDNLNLLNERLCVFEIDAIKDHPILFPVCTIIVMSVFINKMRKMKGQRKMILIEEAWKALMKEGFAEYIQYLVKTVRKFFGETVFVTQESEDIISSPIVKNAIINNSDCKILLDQSKYQNKFDQIQELLGLTEKEKALVLSVNKANDPARKYKEVFISLGGTHSKVYRTEVSEEEYLAYTTEQTEKVKVEAYVQKYGSYRKGIAALADELRQKKEKS
jgi:conjugation system TraG family ATPase